MILLSKIKQVNNKQQERVYIMNIQEKSEQLISEFKDKMIKEAEDAISHLYSDVLPHLENDTYMNVQYRAEDMIKAIMSGAFQKSDNGNGVYVLDSNGLGAYFHITDMMYDTMRENLIKAMPACPKDLKIKSLELTIKHMQDTY
tara:strand:- start:254 stop:685 length:432 start_codon:yes stop_codon:yes gene_type:complete